MCVCVFAFDSHYRAWRYCQCYLLECVVLNVPVSMCAPVSVRWVKWVLAYLSAGFAYVCELDSGISRPKIGAKITLHTCTTNTSVHTNHYC